MTLSYRSALALALPLAALGLTATAQAQTTQYSDRTSFNAAAGGITTFTFDGYAPKNSFTFYGNGLTVGGVKFTASGGHLFVIDPGQGSGDPFGHQFLDADFQSTLTVALPAGTTAFGADFSNYGSASGATVTAVVNGMAFTFAAPGNTSSAFAGFTTSTPLTSLTFSGSATGIALDNVSFGKTSLPSVPEPSAPISLGVGVLGLMGMVAARRKKRVAPGL